METYSGSLGQAVSGTGEKREGCGRELWDREGSYDCLIFRFDYEILRARLPDDAF